MAETRAHISGMWIHILQAGQAKALCLSLFGDFPLIMSSCRAPTEIQSGSFAYCWSKGSSSEYAVCCWSWHVDGVCVCARVCVCVWRYWCWTCGCFSVGCFRADHFTIMTLDQVWATITWTRPAWLTKCSKRKRKLQRMAWFSQNTQQMFSKLE